MKDNGVDAEKYDPTEGPPVLPEPPAVTNGDEENTGDCQGDECAAVNDGSTGDESTTGDEGAVNEGDQEAVNEGETATGDEGAVNEGETSTD